MSCMCIIKEAQEKVLLHCVFLPLASDVFLRFFHVAILLPKLSSDSQVAAERAGRLLQTENFKSAVKMSYGILKTVHLKQSLQEQA